MAAVGASVLPCICIEKRQSVSIGGWSYLRSVRLPRARFQNTYGIAVTRAGHRIKNCNSIMQALIDLLVGLSVRVVYRKNKKA